MRRAEYDQAAGQFHSSQSRASCRAAVDMPRMRQEKHQRAASPRRQSDLLPEYFSESGGLSFAQLHAFPHEYGDFLL